MKGKKKILIIAIIALVAIIAVIVFLKKFKLEENNVTTKEIAEVSNKTIISTLTASGEVEAANVEKIALNTSYYYLTMCAEKEEFVKKGDNLLKYTNGKYLTAPYDCVLISSNLPNEEEICTTEHYIEIQSIDTLCMSLSISETDINKVEIGDEVDITLSATNEKITGYITKISEVGTYSSSGSYFTATVTFENNGNLKIGMSATCEIIIEKAENVVAVPIEAVQTANNQSYVVVVNSDGTTENVNVETGISNDAYTEIKSGLTGNETVQMKETEETSSGFGGRMNFERGGNGGSRENMGDRNPSGGVMPGMPSGGMPGM